MGLSPSGGEYLDHFYENDRLMPCITLVVYWGEEPWRGPRRLSDMFAGNDWGLYAPDYNMHFLDIHRMSPGSREASLNSQGDLPPNEVRGRFHMLANLSLTHTVMNCV